VASPVVVRVFVAAFIALLSQVEIVIAPTLAVLAIAQTLQVAAPKTPVPCVIGLAVVVKVLAHGFPNVVTRFASRAGVVKIPNVSGIALAAVISVLKQKRQGNNTKKIKKRSGGMMPSTGMI